MNKYIIEPGDTIKVEAASDPIGLKIAIVYDAAPEGQVLYYHRFQARNDTTLNITHIDGADISTFGGTLDYFRPFCEVLYGCLTVLLSFSLF